MIPYLHQNDDWPNFTWNNDEVVQLLGEARNLQGRLLSKIVAISNEVFLNELEEIIHNQTNENVEIVVLCAEIEADIAKLEIDIVEGRTISHENAMQHFNECIKTNSLDGIFYRRTGNSHRGLRLSLFNEKSAIHG